MRGQGYDGARNMSSARGVQGHLLAENPKAMYIHCNSHVLNLCITEACGLPPICHMNYTITESAFPPPPPQNSAKRQLFLEKVIDKSTSIVKVKALCRTRWIYRHESYEDFHVLYSSLYVQWK